MSKTKKIIWSGVFIIVLLASIFGIDYYRKLFSNNVRVEEESYLYIPTNASLNDVFEIVKKENIVRNTETFEWVAAKLKYRKVKPGKYKLEKGMSNVDLIRKLRAGEQEPVKITFQNFRLKEEFAGYIDKQLELDSASLLSKLDSMDILREVGLNEENAFCMFIPNTYEFYWNTNAEKFILKMQSHYKEFWNDQRQKQAKKIGLTKAEVSILASIVDQEALINTELQRIAGVYMNRINRDMKLEADPTVIYSLKDFSTKRVLNRMLAFDSPYNTYRYKGLPPGPICMPSVAAIDAVLNYEKHNYIYFCAKEDFSGYHNFAATAAEHTENARKFQKALSRRGILK